MLRKEEKKNTFFIFFQRFHNFINFIGTTFDNEISEQEILQFTLITIAKQNSIKFSRRRKFLIENKLRGDFFKIHSPSG